MPHKPPAKLAFSLIGARWMKPCQCLLFVPAHAPSNQTIMGLSLWGYLLHASHTPAQILGCMRSLVCVHPLQPPPMLDSFPLCSIVSNGCKLVPWIECTHLQCSDAALLKLLQIMEVVGVSHVLEI